MVQNQTATFAGGCFWCIESACNQLAGVIQAECGYTNGEAQLPTYATVTSGTTGHTEAVRITFDPEIISYRQLLEIFFSLHNPTELNRQGNDVGTQYRSGVYYHDQDQQQQAQNIIDEMTTEQIWEDPIVTEVLEVNNYHTAEDYHQDYFNNNPQNVYCQMVVAPKLAKFKQTFVQFMK